MATREIVLCEAVRTPIGAYDGSLKTISAPDLGTVAIKAVLDRSKLDPAKVGTVVMGNVIQAGNKMNPARQSAVHSGIPVDVPAMTVNRVCGSGAQGIASAAQEVMLGMLDSAVAGGMENMDMAPHLVEKGRWGYRMGDGMLWDSMLRDGLNDAFSGAAFRMAHGRFGRSLSRSPAKTRIAGRCARSSASPRRKAAGKFKDEIAPVEVRGHKGVKIFDKDESNRPDTTLEGLSKLRPAFREHGTITAGNAPGLNSGASAMIVADRGWAERQNLKPMARLVSYGIGAVEPGMFGLGPVPAVRQALSRAGWKIADIQRIEINEAFAAIAIAVTRELGLAEDIVNVEGGAVAHGHPIGATGAVLTTRLLYSMQRDGIKRGVVTLCIGGGQGIALTLEAVH